MKKLSLNFEKKLKALEVIEGKFLERLEKKSKQKCNLIYDIYRRTYYQIVSEAEEAKDERELKELLAENPEIIWLFFPVRFELTYLMIRDLAHREGLTPELYIKKVLLEHLSKEYPAFRNYLLKHGYTLLVHKFDRDLKWEMRFFEEERNIPDLKHYEPNLVLAEKVALAYKKVKEDLAKGEKKHRIKLGKLEEDSPVKIREAQEEAKKVWEERKEMLGY